jgi:hypothetical protein
MLTVDTTSTGPGASRNDQAAIMGLDESGKAICDSSFES